MGSDVGRQRFSFKELTCQVSERVRYKTKKKYVASVYHRTAQIFRYFGNAHHEGVVGNEVSCEDFQKGIISRHKNGAVDEGMAAAASPTAAVNKDFS